MRQLYYSDNLPVLRTIPDALVDLVYLDPPFKSDRAYNIIYPDDLGQVTAFEDTWVWAPECDDHLNMMTAAGHPVSGLLDALVTSMGKTQLNAYLVNMAARLVELRRVLKPTGSLYLHCDATASHYLKLVLDAVFGNKNFKNELVWEYSTFHGSKRAYKKNYDQIFFYVRSKNYYFDWEAIAEPYDPLTIKRFDKEDEHGRYKIVKGKKFYMGRGTPPNSCFFIPQLQMNSDEYLGYPTQKPLALLDRIIRASSNLDDIVLDPFCGCGTTISAAENAHRQWIGIDVTYAAIAAIQERFRRERRDIWGEIEIIGRPETPEEVDTKLLNTSSPLYPRKEFEKFCVTVIGGLPNNQMGADGGIDGRIVLANRKQAIVSVKSGRPTVEQIRSLKGLLTDKQIAGVFITRQPPTRPMQQFAQQAGVTQLEGGLFQSTSFPVLQILTLEDILTGKRPALPYQ